MKTFILENIYMSDMSAPSVCSTDRFPTFESAMEEAYKQFKEEAKTYRKSYGADNITTEECYRDLYIKGPDFIDWWTVVEVPSTEEENYFRDLPPYQTVVDAVRILCNAHPELDIYALSAFMPENPAAVGEKYGWLDVYVPEIDAAHRIFVPCGESKAAAAANRLKMPCIDKSFVLLDDYSVNLHDWKEKGGSGIKLRNGINGSIGTWKGPSVSRFNTPETLATLICRAAKIRANA